MRKETFFSSTRFYLIAGIITSLLLPFIVFTKTIWVDVPIEELPLTVLETADTIPFLNENNSNNSEILTSVNWWLLSTIIYLIGISFFFGRFLIQLISLLRLFKRSSVTKDGSFYMVRTKDDTSPFSFFNYIVFNPDLYKKEELEVIIEHEKTHSKQWHSFDILLGHFLAIFLWINPFSWLYKKSIAQNLEFIADDTTSSETATIKEYQYMLLKVATHTQQYSITNNFFNSLIKKRIVMLNQHQSRKHRAWKYALILPLLAAFIMSFNTKTVYKLKKDPQQEKQLLTNKVNDQEIKNVEEIKKPSNSVETASANKITSSNVSIKIAYKDKSIELKITKNTSDDQLNEMVDQLKKEGYTLKFKKVKRNSNNEITAINISLKNENGSASNFSVNDTDSIKPVTILSESEGGKNYISIYSDHNKRKHKVHKKKHKRKNKDGKKYKHEEIEVIEEIVHEETIAIEEQREIDKIIDVIEEEQEAEEIIDVVEEEQEVEEIIDVVEEYQETNGFLSVDVGKNPNDKIKLINEGNEKPLIIVNGKEVTQEQFEKIKSGDVQNIDIAKGQNALIKYGEKAKNGVVIITLKK